MRQLVAEEMPRQFALGAAVAGRGRADRPFVQAKPDDSPAQRQTTAVEPVPRVSPSQRLRPKPHELHFEQQVLRPELRRQPLPPALPRPAASLLAFLLPVQGYLRPGAPVAVESQEPDPGSEAAAPE